MSDIEKMMAELDDIKEIKKTLTSWLKEEANAGKECFHTESCGAVSDIIKDMSETMKNCLESMYYETVIKAMESKEHPSYGEDEIYGYNHRHMANGQFARSGSGHMVRGYRPYMDQEPYINAYMHDPNFEERVKHHESMGYDGEYSHSRNIMKGSRHGDTFDHYRQARRNYHDSKSMTDKEEMDTHHMMYMQDTLKNLKAMWDDADPMLKKRIKEDFGEEMVEVLEKM